MRRGTPRTWLSQGRTAAIATGMLICATALLGGQAGAQAPSAHAKAHPAAVRPAELEVDLAKAGSPSGDVSYKCVSSPNAKICFQPYGDYFFAYDRKADGYPATVNWDMPGGRQGQCINKLGAGHWGYCNKDLPENLQVNITAWYNGKPYTTSTLT